MKTTKANATNNFILRIWSHNHYGTKLNESHNIYRGTITDCETKEEIHFHSVGEFLKIIETLYKKREKDRRK